MSFSSHSCATDFVGDSGDEGPPAAHAGEVMSVDDTPTKSKPSGCAQRKITRTHLTHDEKTAIFLDYVALGTKPPHGSVAALCRRYNVGRRYAADLKRSYERAKDIVDCPSLARKIGSGRPTFWTPEKVWKL